MSARARINVSARIGLASSGVPWISGTYSIPVRDAFHPALVRWNANLRGSVLTFPPPPSLPLLWSKLIDAGSVEGRNTA